MRVEEATLRTAFSTTTSVKSENPPENFPKKYSSRLTGFERRISAVPCSYSSDIEPAEMNSAMN